MKTHRIEIDRFRSASNSSHGTVSFRVDARVTPQRPDPERGEESSLITLSEADARVLMALLKQQLAAFDGRKARSQR